MTKAVFFDWDGTLVDSLPLLYASHNHVRAVLGYPLWSPEEYRQAIVYSTRELYPTLYADRAGEAQDILYTYIKDNHLQALELLDGAHDLIDTLFNAGVTMGVVSNKRHDILRREVEHLGWDKYFVVYNGAGVAKADKPSGEPLLYALQEHAEGLIPSDVIYIGDTESDLGCAEGAGCPVAFIRHGKTELDPLISRYNPAYVVDTLPELKKILMDVLGFSV